MEKKGGMEPNPSRATNVQEMSKFGGNRKKCYSGGEKRGTFVRKGFVRKGRGEKVKKNQIGGGGILTRKLFGCKQNENSNWGKRERLFWKVNNDPLGNRGEGKRGCPALLSTRKLFGGR